MPVNLIAFSIINACKGYKSLYFYLNKHAQVHRQEIEKVLEEIADLLDMKGENKFRIHILL